MGNWIKGCAIGCGVVSLVVGLALFAGFNWFRRHVQAPMPPAPRIAANSVVRPTMVRMNGKPFSAGTAAAVRLRPGSAPVLITALHLFGTAGGLERNLAPEELDQEIAALMLRPMAGGKAIALARGAVLKSGAPLPEGETDVTPDAAAFHLTSGSRLKALPLAAQRPGMFDWVWLVGDRFDAPKPRQRLFPGRILVENPGRLVVRFEESFPLQGFSGAPVVNAKGEVVGILISGDDSGAGGASSAVLNPCTNIRRMLGAAGWQ